MFACASAPPANELAARPLGSGGDELRLEVVSERAGTMRFAQVARVHARSGSPLVLTSSIEESVLAPILDRAIRVSGARHVVLGSSSAGSGTESVHAVLIEERPEGVVLLDQVIWTARRAEARVELREDDGTLWLGVMTASEVPADRVEWRLSFGTHELDADAAAGLSLEPIAPAGRALASYPERAERRSGRPLLWLSTRESEFELAGVSL